MVLITNEKNQVRMSYIHFFFFLTIINSTLPHSVNIGIYKYIIVREEFRMEEKKIEQIEGEK